MTPEQEKACAIVDGWPKDSSVLAEPLKTFAEVGIVLRQALTEAQEDRVTANKCFNEGLADVEAERDAAMRRIEALEEMVRLYLSTYADTQTHPAPSQEAECINTARAALAYKM